MAVFRIIKKSLKSGIVTGTHPAVESRAQPLTNETKKKAEPFRRSLTIREVDTGSCNACEMEMNALTNPVYDIERFGIHIAASPRHADALVVTGPVTFNMERALKDVYKQTPDPKVVIALGDCAINCGMFKGSYAVTGPVERHIPVDVRIAGCPPRPTDILAAFAELREHRVSNRWRAFLGQMLRTYILAAAPVLKKLYGGIPIIHLRDPFRSERIVSYWERRRHALDGRDFLNGTASEDPEAHKRCKRVDRHN